MRIYDLTQNSTHLVKHIIDLTKLQNLRIENKGMYPSVKTLTSDHLYCAWTLTVMVNSLPYMAAPSILGGLFTRKRFLLLSLDLACQKFYSLAGVLPFAAEQKVQS